LKEQLLNTTELADAVAEAYDIPNAKAREIVSSIFALVIDAAKKATKSLLARRACASCEAQIASVQRFTPGCV
jgi:hypothetical protein